MISPKSKERNDSRIKVALDASVQHQAARSQRWMLKLSSAIRLVKDPAACDVLVVGAACSRLPLAAANAVGNAAASSGPIAAGPDGPRNPAAKGSKRQSKTSKPSPAGTVAAAGGVVKVVADDWIQACADAGRLLPTDTFEAAVRRRAAEAAAGAATAEAARAREGAQGGQLSQYRAWLGHWDERLAGAHDMNELMLNADFSDERAAANGNLELSAVLRQVAGYEKAVTDTKAAGGEGSKAGAAPRDLVYSRAAGAVKACAWRIGPDTTEQQLVRGIPFVSKKVAADIREILDTGSCSRLNNMRNDLPVVPSRPESTGAHTRKLLAKLPGVGFKTAAKLYACGVRSFDQLERLAADADWRAGPGAEAGLRAEAYGTLRFWRDLTEDVPEEDRQEMQQAVEAAVEVATGLGGWVLTPVGGAARGKGGGHDADFLLHRVGREGQLLTPQAKAAGAVSVVQALHDRLVAQDKILPCDCDGGQRWFGQVASGSYYGWRSKFKPNKQDETNNANERLDHLYCLFKTAAGKMRRMDVVHVPYWKFPYVLQGWVGSTTWLRMLQVHATNRGMRWSKIGLFRWAPATSQHQHQQHITEDVLVGGSGGSESEGRGGKRRRTDGPARGPVAGQIYGDGSGGGDASSCDEDGGGDDGDICAAGGGSGDGGGGGQRLDEFGEPVYSAGDDPFGIGGMWLLVPDEAPPSRDKLGREDWWPEGWGPGRRVESERAIFELLGLPFREFTQRNI